ncbi:MAG: class I SAM-dependent methyltransferase [Methylocystis sp.]|uniref:class I SAM-dependent methyltransferase n=1 Tax=Methylocystis sp. TaxID=1911079 RepID=UPI003DA455CB
MVSNRKFTRQDIRNLYASEAEKHGVGGASTIQDMRTRLFEIEAIASYLRDDIRVLEIGCGNGYLATRMIEKFSIFLEGFDFSEELISVAKSQTPSHPRGSASFEVGDVLTYDKKDTFDLAYSVRCIQNLQTFDDQKIALRNIAASLKVGGEYIMDECFWTGLNNLNEARAELELAPIAESWHNTFFHEAETIEYMKSLGCAYVEQNAFLSGYYFGSRILLPALSARNKKISSSSRLNDYFVALPPAGDFCPMKVIRFRRER